MHSLNDSLKLNLFHMGRSHFFKNHSNKLNFQNPSIHRLTSTCLAPTKNLFKIQNLSSCGHFIKHLADTNQTKSKHYSVQCFGPNLFPIYTPLALVDHLTTLTKPLAPWKVSNYNNG